MLSRKLTTNHQKVALNLPFAVYFVRSAISIQKKTLGDLVGLTLHLDCAFCDYHILWIYQIKVLVNCFFANGTCHFIWFQGLDVLIS